MFLNISNIYINVYITAETRQLFRESKQLSINEENVFRDHTQKLSRSCDAHFHDLEET